MAAALYATREQLKSALDVKETSRSNAQIDRALASSSRSVEGQLHRIFYPQTATKYFAWPNTQRSKPWRLWFNQPDQLISVTTFTSGGTTIASTDYFLEPANEGPPYDHLEIDLASSASFTSNTGTSQRSLSIAGLWGFRNDEESVGTLASSLAASTSATASITWSTARVGVGDILRINSERMIITERGMIDTTQNLQAPGLASNTSATSVVVSNGAAFSVDQIILIEAERMLIVDIASNTLIVKRAWDSTALAAHTAGVDIYALTGVTLERAQLGTSLAAHNSSDVIYRWVPPALINDLTIAEGLTQLGQEWSSYARVIGSGDNQREAGGKGLEAMRMQAYQAYGRGARMRSV